MVGLKFEVSASPRPQTVHCRMSFILEQGMDRCARTRAPACAILSKRETVKFAGRAFPTGFRFLDHGLQSGGGPI